MPDSAAMKQLANSLDAGVESGALEGLHALVVLQRGELVFERYWTAADECWGRPLGPVAFGAEVLHDLRSVTKSIVGLLYGIALERRLVPPAETPLLEAFPEHRHLADDPRRRRETVEQVLTMTLGNRWEEGTDYSDPKNAEHAMELAPDRVRFVLEQPMEREPGEIWHYSGGATALLGALLVRGTGQTLGAFAREALFAPLGIEAMEWVQGPRGDDVPASGLRLRPRDLARVGQLVLQGGRWQGRALVPAAWLERSMTPRIGVGEGRIGYGYHWYLSAPHPPVDWFGAFGNGGQSLTVHRETGAVVAINGGRYNRPDASRLPLAVELEHVFPALTR
jgi:CubicO group peptidase (beta-lactamase class C family)